MFDAYNHCTDDLSVAFPFWPVLPPHLCPEDRCAMEDFQFLSSIDFDFVGNIRTFDDRCVISVSRLNEISSFIQVSILVHDKIFIITTQS